MAAEKAAQRKRLDPGNGDGVWFSSPGGLWRLWSVPAGDGRPRHIALGVFGVRLLGVGACVPSGLVSLFFFRLSVGPSSALGFFCPGSFGGVGFYGRFFGCRRRFALRAPLGGWAPPKEPEQKKTQGLWACPPSYTKKKTESPVPRYSAQTPRRHNPKNPKGKESRPATASNNRPQPPETSGRAWFCLAYPWFLLNHPKFLHFS